MVWILSISILGSDSNCRTGFDGDGLADDPTLAPFDALNITTGELEKLAQLYPNATPTTPAGLWRVPMMHFSNFHWAMFASRAVEAGDDNWPLSCSTTRSNSWELRKPHRKILRKCDNASGSTIQVQAQIFGETVP